MLVLTNTLSGKKEPFSPIHPGKVGMYVCGPTVYNFIHIGNARPAVFFDVARRYLELIGFEVHYVRNYTDVEDKIIQKAREEKVACEVITERYIKEYEIDMDLLKVRPSTHTPRVTEYIPEIISFIEGLIKNEVAYVSPKGEVFFAVRKFKEYGKLSGKNIDDLISGARVQPGEDKKDPLDFSLWKPKKNDDEPAWDSPWGKGRPGWHIECSAMAVSLIGETFDIHGGGVDLIHPHHENEIAQSEGLTNKPFARYWLHSNMLSFNAEKMSKSLGNVVLNRDFVNKFTAETLRYLLLSAHYRSVIDFSDRHVKECQSALHRVYSALGKAEQFVQAEGKPAKATSTEENELKKIGEAFAAQWKASMDDDLNTAKALGYVFEYVRAINAYIDKRGFQPTSFTAGVLNQFLTEMKHFSKIFNLFGEGSGYLLTLKKSVLKERGIEEADILAAISSRTEARQKKDFAKSDAIRDELLQKGIELRDAGTKTDWDIVFT